MIVDTGVVFAAMDRSDGTHAPARQRLAVCERLGETTIATLDRRHFSVVRPRHVGAFTLLP